MQPSLDVMKDLMVVYLSGEASADTRSLVEDYARRHPDFARLLTASSQGLPIESAAPSTDAELKALKMTRQHLFLRSLFSAMGIFFTLLPFTIVFQHGQITFLLYRDPPGAALAFWAVAAASWTACYLMHRSVRRAGL